MKKGWNRVINFMLILLFVCGIGLLLYPTVSNYWNELHQTQAITRYTEKVTELDEQAYEELRQAAVEYNDALRAHGTSYALSEEQREQYESLLDVSGLGVMGYIEIPKIELTLPIYHGTAESVLQIAVGHLEWTSLPIGGESTHCVLSGHRGLPSAKLFTNLDKLTVGDTFILKVLDEVLTYEVDQILVVEPQDTKELEIVEGEDYCTLVTCTPYGINTHRLLVRGKRMEEKTETQLRVTADAVQVAPEMAASVVVIPFLLVLLLGLLLPRKKKKYSGGEVYEEI